MNSILKYEDKLATQTWELVRSEASVWKKLNNDALENAAQYEFAFSGSYKFPRLNRVGEASNYFAFLLSAQISLGMAVCTGSIHMNRFIEVQTPYFSQANARFLFPKAEARATQIEKNPEAKPQDEELKTIFNGLVKNWREETGGFSLTMRRYAHRSYQSILALEPKREVIKLILLELQSRPDRWFEALKVLSKTNPALEAKTFEETVQAWINWGKSEKYIS